LQKNHKNNGDKKMKKFLSIALLTFCVAIYGTVFTACKKDVITNVFLSYESGDENIYLSQKSSDADNKSFEYEITTQYGAEIETDDFTLWKTINQGDSFKVNKQADGTAGYTLESDLPASAVPAVGTYTLKFSFEGWTNTVKVIIEKKTVSLPNLNNFNEIVYDGKDYTSRIVYDKSVVTMLDESERIYPIESESADLSRYYNVEFALKDKTNYCWADKQLGSENYTFSFEINQKQLAVDVAKYFKVDPSDGHYVQGNTPMLKYDMRENFPKNLNEVLALPSLTIDDGVISEFSDLVELKLIQTPHWDPIEVDEINAAGYYYLALMVKDSRCYAIGTTTQTTAFLSRIDLLTIEIS